MSRVGKQPIKLPKGVEAKLDGASIIVKGPKGVLNLEVKNGIKVLLDKDVVTLVVESGDTTKFQGLYRSLINNMVIGVTDGFKKQLELIGVGYRAQVKGNELDLQLGFSHPTMMKIPNGIEIKIEKNTLVTVSGIDKQLIGQFSAHLRSLRKPEPYKGKGIRYLGEYVRKKAGKSGAKK